MCAPLGARGQSQQACTCVPPGSAILQADAAESQAQAIREGHTALLRQRFVSTLPMSALGEGNHQLSHGVVPLTLHRGKRPQTGGLLRGPTSWIIGSCPSHQDTPANSTASRKAKCMFADTTADTSPGSILLPKRCIRRRSACAAGPGMAEGPLAHEEGTAGIKVALGAIVTEAAVPNAIEVPVSRPSGRWRPS